MNIHDYPIKANPLDLARYQVAVMEAYEKGAIIECNEEGLGWLTCYAPHWYWKNDVWYRVQKPKPKVALGHNPQNVEESLVNIAAGYRLLTKEEIEDGKHRTISYDIECLTITNNWYAGWAGDSLSCTYRTNKPAGFFLKIKDEYVAWTFDTAPKGTVLLQISPDMIILITIWGVDKVGCGAVDISYQRLFTPDIKYSIDNGATWNLCRTKKL